MESHNETSNYNTTNYNITNIIDQQEITRESALLEEELQKRASGLQQENKQLKTLNITIKELKKNTLERGQRIANIRKLLNLSVNKFAKVLGLHSINLRRFESGFTCIKESVAYRIHCRCLSQIRLLVDVDWIMNGAGNEPMFVSQDASNSDKDGLLNIINELQNPNPINSIYRNNLIINAIMLIIQLAVGSDKAVSFIINDRKMEPKYYKGMRVSGYWIDNYESIEDGQDYMIQKENNILYIRKVFLVKDDEQKLHLVSLNTDYKPEETLYTNVKIAKILSVIQDI